MGCPAAMEFCVGPYAALLAGICPSTCGTCADYCTDNDAMMALWATQNAEWPTTCAAAVATNVDAILSDGVFVNACGASSDKCVDVTPTPKPKSKRIKESSPCPTPTATPTLVPTPVSYQTYPTVEEASGYAS